MAFIQPRHRNRANYIQRWKVLRDRNKSLPKLDFIAKASGVPKKFHETGSFSRSYTYDSMKLPSISTCSVITGVSGKSVHSDGYRKKDSNDKRNIQVALNYKRWKYNQPKQTKDQHSESYTDLSTQRDFRDLTAALSKSLQSLAAQEEKARQEETKPKPDTSHRYENISYKKHLLKRQRNNAVPAPEKSKRSRDVAKYTKLEVEHAQKPVEREYVLVKDHTKASPRIGLNSGKRENSYVRGKKSKSISSESSRTDITKRSETITATPDDLTLPSTVTITSPKSNFSQANTPLPTIVT